MTMSLNNARARYGDIFNNVWDQESRHCSMWTMPDDMRGPLCHWINTATNAPVVHIYSLNDMHAPLEQALRAVIFQGLVQQLRTFDGCFNIRGIRGHENLPSAHSWAGAIDINVATNALGTPGDMSNELAQCFVLQGFTWGKNFRRMDPQHLSFLGF